MYGSEYSNNNKVVKPPDFKINILKIDIFIEINLLSGYLK